MIFLPNDDRFIGLIDRIFHTHTFLHTQIQILVLFKIQRVTNSRIVRPNQKKIYIVIQRNGKKKGVARYTYEGSRIHTESGERSHSKGCDVGVVFLFD